MTSNDLLTGYLRHRAEQEQQYEAQNLWANLPLWSSIETGARKTPNHIAVSDNELSLTYQQLLFEADKVASGLVNEGYLPGDRVVFQWPNNVHFAIIFFGILRAGLVPVMALPAHGYNEIVHFISTSGAKAYITTDDNGSDERLRNRLQFEKTLPTLKNSYCCGSTDAHDVLPQGNVQAFTPPSINPHDPALFLVSGGTTGLPKLIPRTHNDYAYNATSSAQLCELNAEDSYLVVLPAAHNFPLACPGMIGTLSVGGKVVFTTDSSPDHCFDLIEQHQITFTSLVPALVQVWSLATEWEPANLNSLKLLQVGGAKLSETDARKAISSFPGVLQQVFGMAEGLLCYTRLDDDEEVIVKTQGRPMSPFDEIRLVDDEGNDVPAGSEGELSVRGPTTLRGYYRAESHNLRAFTPEGFYKSGDRVCIQADGNFVVTGRIKDVINRAGETIAADEIEDMLLTHDSIHQVAVLAVPDKDYGERIGAAIVFIGKPLALAEIRDYLSGRGMAAFKLPERLQVMKKLPITAVGKIDKKRIAFE